MHGVARFVEHRVPGPRRVPWHVEAHPLVVGLDGIVGSEALIEQHLWCCEPPAVRPTVLEPHVLDEGVHVL
eukprot:8669111-Lingulodinium_polyedra.AAC.1